MGDRPPSARSVASVVLGRVVREGAFAAAALDAELERASQLSASDKRLATELTYGVLRFLPFLDGQLAQFAPRGIDKLDASTRIHLLVAAYQLLLLDRIPSFAAVNEAVALVRHARGQGLARFANAVLRRLASIRTTETRDLRETALRASIPPWLLDSLARSAGGEDQALAALSTSLVPPIGLRVRTGESVDHWREAIAQANPHAEIAAGRVSPRCLNLRGGGHPQQLPGHRLGWVVQEEGAQVIGLSLGVRPGEMVLDACAGRGNKTILLAEQACSGVVDAADLHPRKLERLRLEAKALGVPLGNTHAVDWTEGCGEVPGNYDCVLVDAPCSGSGTLRRRPELLGRLDAASIGRFQDRQVAILERAASRCRPGGRVVYAVCSVLEEEGPGVVERILREVPGLVAAPFAEAWVANWTSGRAWFRLLPHEHGTDGYYAASFVRRG